MNKKRAIIVANYADTGESYGLLGPQMAATIIQANTDYDCIVVAIEHDFDKDSAIKQLLQIIGNEKPVIGFSNLGGRTDLWDFARELTGEGWTTILAGPQSDVDFAGEIGHETYPYRFSGASGCFRFALHGPAEQVIPFLNNTSNKNFESVPGLLYLENNKCRINPQAAWREEFLNKVNWRNLYLLTASGIKPVEVSTAQVVQQIGCPYASRTKEISIDYPVTLGGVPFCKEGAIKLEIAGCSFCDVARDKGFAITLSLESVITQIRNLPEDAEGRKIPFEIINETPLAGLPRLLSAIQQQGLKVTQINLVTRADWLLAGKEQLITSLKTVQRMDVHLLLSALGFESFSDRILQNLNKGYNVQTNLDAVKFLRELKEDFPEHLLYTTAEGANHGFIHPTPWDSEDTIRELNTNILVYGLGRDVLPQASVPLIIHHACALGDWVRELEAREGLTLKRRGSIIEWW
jgi:hypothetical protein